MKTDDDSRLPSDAPPPPPESKGVVFELFAALINAVFGVDITDTESSKTPDNPITDFGHDVWSNFKNWRLSAVVIYQVTFVTLLIYFIVTAYTDARTKSFITLDNTSGVCKDDSKSTTCCEVPQTITGTFLADTRGRWNTQNNFSYINNNYAVTVAGLEYTNAQWADVMKNITVQLSNIGLKGEKRDLAWNMIAWSAFTAQNLDRGFLQFYATGTANVMFDKPIMNAGVASAASQTAECAQAMDVSYSATDASLDVSIALCDKPEGECNNPCPSILAPQAMGYDPFSSQETTLDLRLSMQAVATALAVNLGMITLNHLVMIPGDNDRLTLLDEMVSQGAIDAWTANHTSSYYDQLHVPTPPIYCYSANTPVQDSNTWVSGNAFCLVRMGNTLAYPVTTSYGWSADGTSYPTQCTKDAASQDGSAAKYYCNKFDVNVGLIYYPVPNQNTSATYTYAPSKSPTERPTPPPGAPTIFPTTAPTIKPTRLPSARPTPPPGAPTIAPTTHKPTRKPSASPTKRPSGAPTFRPTANPTVAPTMEPTADPTFAPTTARRKLQTEYDDDDDDGGGDDGAGDDGAGDDGAGDDGDAADDQYATTGIGTYSSPYFANSATDDFSPLIPEVVDNGLIFALGKYGAVQLNKVNSSTGDLAISNNAYYAMVDTVAGLMDDKNRGYKKDFKKLCSASVDPSIAEGCAMMAFNFDGQNSREISNYFYQPSSTPAFSNTLYIKNEMISLQKNTPTSLIQTYYSCVLAPWPALLAAVGIGSSSAGVFVTVGFAFYVFCALMVLNKFFGANIPSKKAMAAAEKAAQDLKDQEVEIMRAVVAALRVDVQSGRVNLPSVSKAFDDTAGDLRKAQVTAEHLAIRGPSDSSTATPSTAPPVMEVELNPMRGAKKDSNV